MTKKDKPTGAKRKQGKSDNDIINAIIESALENLIDEITDVKKEVSKYRQLVVKHRFSPSYTASFVDDFQCSICHKHSLLLAVPIQLFLGSWIRKVHK